MRSFIAYSVFGKVISNVLQSTVYKNSRAHWIRDALAGNKLFSELLK